MNTKFKNYISEGFDFGAKDEKDLDSFETRLPKDKLLSLFRTLKSNYPAVEYPLALNLGTGEVKIRIKDFDVDTWKKENLSANRGMVKIGMGSINSSGGSLKGAEWEEVICACYNMRSSKVDLEKAKTLAGIEKTWKSKYNAAIDDGFKIVDSAWKNPTGVMKHYGSGSANLTKEWDAYFITATGKPATGLTKTPKTDMYIGSQHISLKKAGGSQLMSGGVAESLATLGFVYENLPLRLKTKEFTDAFRTLESDIANKFTKINVGKNKSVTDIKKEIKAGVDNDITQRVSEALASHSEMQAALQRIFSTLEARKEFVRESMTGNSKFADSLAIATHILVFDPVQGKASYKAIDDKLITEYAKAVGFQINFKKAGSSSTPYSNLRGSLTNSVIFDDDITSHDLTEAMLGRFKGFLSRIVTTSLSRVWKRLTNLFSKSMMYVNKITGRRMTISREPFVKWKL